MENNLDLLNVADMNSYVFSSPEKPIIGTCALVPCMGVLFKDSLETYALAHILHDYEGMIMELVSKLSREDKIDVVIIPGTETREETIVEFEKFLNNRDNFLLNDFCIKIVSLSDFVNKDLDSIEFGYDTRTGQFIKIDYDKYFQREEGRV